MTDKETVPTLAAKFVPQSPFDDAHSDLVLRSSDGVDFHVSRVVLSLISPFFRNIIDNIQPQDDANGPVFLVDESAGVLDRVLCFCYPGAQPVVETLDQLREILDVALRKYEIQSIVPFGKAYLRQYLAADPVAVFAIACHHRWKVFAQQAAKMCLRLPLRTFATASPVQLKYITADVYHALLQYHAACGNVAKAATSSLKWLAFFDALPWLTCDQAPDICPDDTGLWDLADHADGKITSWFMTYLRAAAAALAVRPLARLDSPALLHEAMGQMAQCPFCREDGFRQLLDFANATLPHKIEADIDLVSKPARKFKHLRFFSLLPGGIEVELLNRFHGLVL